MSGAHPDPSGLASETLAWSEQWFDPDRQLLWNPPGAFEGMPERSLHLVPQSAWYAVGLLARDAPGDVGRAHGVLGALCDLQYDEPGTVWHGTFARFAEWPHPTVGAVEWEDYDPNWRQFCGTTFAVILHRLGDAIEADLRSRLEHAIDLAVVGEPSGRVEPGYTNIALMKAWLEADAGVRRGDPLLAAAGETLGGSVVRLHDHHGTFEEYNSPTYYGIDLYALALWRALPPTDWFGTEGARLEVALWRDTARWYHAGLRNLCGPYTRSYGMDLHDYVGLVGLWAWAGAGRDLAPVPDLDDAFEHGHDLCLGPVVALLGAPLPEEMAAALAGFPGEHVVRQLVTDDPERVATAWLHDRVMAGGERHAGGWSAGWQYHPVTAHWAAPDGGVGWLRGLHDGPTPADADPGTLRLTAHPNRAKGAVPVSFRVRAPGVDPGAVTAGRWRLPGLDVQVATPAHLEAVDTRRDGLRILYQPGPEPTPFELELRPA